LITLVMNLVILGTWYGSNKPTQHLVPVSSSVTGGSSLQNEQSFLEGRSLWNELP